MRMRLSAVAAAGALFALVAGASAQEFCVTCSGPPATYRCLIGGDNTNMAARSSRGQFLCITELAKAGAHASCSATRGQTTPCPGETRTVMFSLADPATTPLATPAPSTPALVPVPSSTATAPGQDLPPVALPPPQPQPATAPPPIDTGAAPPEEKPNAVEDFADKTGKAVSDTGKAVGNAVKKSWDCVTSLFGNC